MVGANNKTSPLRPAGKPQAGEVYVPSSKGAYHFVGAGVEIEGGAPLWPGSTTQPSGVAPIAEFNEVFNPAGFPFSTAPQAAMQGMMQYVNFVSEEWPHVLIWDLFVGRYIWLDGERRGVFTPHSVLLTNLIGPPGLMLHFLTCVLTGKGLPPTEEEVA